MGFRPKIYVEKNRILLSSPYGRARGGKAQWRRSETSFPNRLAAARARAWRRWRGTTAQQQKGPFWPEDFWIDHATQWSRRSIGMTARRQARMRARAHTARTDRSRHARHDHGAHGSVTARTDQSRRARLGHGARASVTARTSRSRRARIGHGTHGTITACTDRSRSARIGHCRHVSIAVCAARHGRHCGHSGPGGLGDATITALLLSSPYEVTVCRV
jgi:hypothetical protein